MAKKRETIPITKMTKKMSNSAQIEKRAFNVESRVENESRLVYGYAALYDNTTRIMDWYDEEIAQGAFDSAQMDDVRALFNHDPNLLLARTKSGTLSLSVDERGLKYEFEAPNTSAGNDLLEMLRRGDVSQSSFAFTIAGEEWIEEKGMKPKRRITKVERLYDVSPVTYPAYPDTTAAKRSFDHWKEKHAPEPQNDLAKKIEQEQAELRVSLAFYQSKF